MVDHHWVGSNFIKSKLIELPLGLCAGWVFDLKMRSQATAIWELFSCFSETAFEGQKAGRGQRGINGNGRSREAAPWSRQHFLTRFGFQPERNLNTGRIRIIDALPGHATMREDSSPP